MSSGGAPISAGTPVFTKHNWDLASLMQFLAECLIIVAGAVWTRDLLPSDEYDSVWGAMVYKLTYVSNY